MSASATVVDPRLRHMNHSNCTHSIEGGSTLTAAGDDLHFVSSTFNVEAYRSIAIRILAEANGRRPNPDYEEVERALANAVIHIPPAGQDFRHCTIRNQRSRSGQTVSTVAAFVNRRQIYLCRTALQPGNTRDLPQILIHEAVHVAGYDNECFASQVEISAVGDSRRTPFTNEYLRQCGITTDFRLPYPLANHDRGNNSFVQPQPQPQPQYQPQYQPRPFVRAPK